MSSQADPLPSKAPPGCVGPWGHRREAGQIRRGRRKGPSQTGGAAEERRAFALPTGAQEACWAPRWGPLPSETRGGGHTRAPLFLELKPHCPQPPGAFSSPVGPEHWPCPPPKPCPCLGPALHSQGLPPSPFFLFPPPLFYYCGTNVPSGYWFIYIFIFTFFLTCLLGS